MGSEADTSSPSPRSPRRRTRPSPPLAGRFRELSDADLDGLADEQLVTYIARARRAKHFQTAGRALAILMWGYEPSISVRVAKKVPGHAVENVAEKVLKSVIDDALEGKVPFSGASVPEFRSWLGTIISRRIADYYRGPRSTMTRLGLAEEVGEDEPGVQLETRDAADAVVDRALVQEALGRMSPAHRTVAQMAELDGYSAAEVTAAVPGMSANNVYKIRERFRTQVAELVAEAEQTGQ